MVPVLEAVPNFSEGRDPAFVEAVMDAARAEGVDVLDGSADEDHHRCVVTWVGDPRSVEAAAIAAGRLALEHIDLRRHSGVHPRVGALDVLPLVPLCGLDMHDAVASARRVGEALAELGIPVYLYGQASDPPGRGLTALRRGGFEALVEGFPPGRRPDFDAGRSAAHPTAGVTCVGARPLLLAWNVRVADVSLDTLRGLADRLRERGGGFRGLRALAFDLERSGVVQLSMNLEEVERHEPMAVFEAVEAAVRALGGRIAGTEVIGMIPAPLVLGAATRRLDLLDANESRFLPSRLTVHLAERVARDAGTVFAWIEGSGQAVPRAVHTAMERLTGRTLTEARSGDDG
jgi:glutamate formiminotransferase